MWKRERRKCFNKPQVGGKLTTHMANMSCQVQGGRWVFNNSGKKTKLCPKVKVSRVIVKDENKMICRVKSWDNLFCFVGPRDVTWCVRCEHVMQRVKITTVSRVLVCYQVLLRDRSHSGTAATWEISKSDVCQSCWSLSNTSISEMINIKRLVTISLVVIAQTVKQWWRFIKILFWEIYRL